MKLVCFGGGKFNQDEVSKVEKLGLGNVIVHKEGGDNVLSEFYKAATLFIYPSIYEGFGIPPLKQCLQVVRCQPPSQVRYQKYVGTQLIILILLILMILLNLFAEY